MKPNQKYERARQNEQQSEKGEERQQKRDKIGCFTLFYVIVLGTFGVTTHGFALLFTAAFPVWASYLLGGVITAVIIAGMFAIGGDMMDVVSRLLFMAIVVGLLVHTFITARDNALRSHQKALKSHAQNSTSRNR